VQALLAFFHLYDIDALIRVPTREKTQLYRYLEDGAAGLIIPHVSTPEEVEDLVKKVKFPPVGDRGLAPPNLQANYGLDTLESRQPLVDHALRETYLIIQIETPLGVANMDAIAAVSGLDGVFVGPSDLALRMQYEPEDRRLTYQQSLEKIAAACAANGIFWGTMSNNVDDVRMQVELGARMLMWGTDTTLLRAGLDQCASDLDAVMAGE
jgi:2-keto-3-deoxy-L-rhamnonate aldolase RhmA